MFCKNKKRRTLASAALQRCASTVGWVEASKHNITLCISESFDFDGGTFTLILSNRVMSKQQENGHSRVFVDI